jgi:hypothetical protein
LVVVLPWFATGTFERVINEGEVPTAYTLARMLSNIPISASGPTRIIHYDIHQLAERFFYTDAAIPLFASAVPLFCDILHQDFANETIAIVFPDDGASKRVCICSIFNHFSLSQNLQNQRVGASTDLSFAAKFVMEKNESSKLKMEILKELIVFSLTTSYRVVIP